jgi:hypothetical protein
LAVASPSTGWRDSGVPGGGYPTPSMSGDAGLWIFSYPRHSRHAREGGACPVAEPRRRSGGAWPCPLPRGLKSQGHRQVGDWGELWSWSEGMPVLMPTKPPSGLQVVPGEFAPEKKCRLCPARRRHPAASCAKTAGGCVPSRSTEGGGTHLRSTPTSSPRVWQNCACSIAL